MLWRLCGSPRSAARDGEAHRWGRTQGKIGFHGGKVEIERPRVRDLNGPGACAAELGGGGRGGLARQVGDEPDADQRLDAQVRPCGAACRRAMSGARRGRRVEIGGVAPLRGAVGRAHEGMDGARICPSWTSW